MNFFKLIIEILKHNAKSFAHIMTRDIDGEYQKSMNEINGTKGVVYPY